MRRKKTEQSILAALEEQLIEGGMQGLGINVVAKRAGVSKELIYRYFGGMPGLMLAWMQGRDYWSSKAGVLGSDDTSNLSPAALIAAMLREQEAVLARDQAVAEVRRWELVERSEIGDQLRERREREARKFIDRLDGLTDEADVPAFVGILLAGPLAALLAALFAPAQVRARLGEARQSALNDSDLAMPSVAIANAARELMVICERVETMMTRVPDLYRNPDAVDAAEMQGLDDEVDAIHTAIKFYLSRIPDDALDSSELERVNEILAATIKLEQIADIITRNLVTKAQKKASRGVDFSTAGWDELRAMHGEVLANTRRAFSVVLSGDVELARELARSKERLRNLEQESEMRHLERLRAGDPKSRETSTLHMDIVRDLKEINSLLVSLTYPVLAREGMLRPSRLV